MFINTFSCLVQLSCCTRQSILRFNKSQYFLPPCISPSPHRQFQLHENPILQWTDRAMLRPGQITDHSAVPSLSWPNNQLNLAGYYSLVFYLLFLIMLEGKNHLLQWFQLIIVSLLWQQKIIVGSVTELHSVCQSGSAADITQFCGIIIMSLISIT